MSSRKLNGISCTINTAVVVFVVIVSVILVGYFYLIFILFLSNIVLWTCHSLFVMNQSLIIMFHTWDCYLVFTDFSFFTNIANAWICKMVHVISHNQSLVLVILNLIILSSGFSLIFINILINIYFPFRFHFAVDNNIIYYQLWCMVYFNGIIPVYIFLWIRCPIKDLFANQTFHEIKLILK